MSDPSPPRTGKKGASSKKSRKKQLDKRSAEDHGTLTPITEGESHKTLFDEDGNPILETSEKSDSDEKEQSEGDVMMNYLREMRDEFRSDMAFLGSRIEHLESQSNPKDNSKDVKTPRQHRDKKKEPANLLKSVAESSVKRDWRKMFNSKKTGAEEEEDDEDHYTNEEYSSNSDHSDQESHYEEFSPTQSRERESKEKEDNNEDRRAEREKIASLGHLFRSIDASEQRVAKTVVNVTRTEKECNVRIDKFTLGPVCKAIKAILEFQEREGTKANMAKILSTSCKKHLKLKYNISSTDLPDMPMSMLFAVMSRETKVHSKVQFYDELKAAVGNVQLMDWDSKVNASNHEEYYFQQLSLAHDFMRIFRLMLPENKEYCPSVNDKENGLIRLFRSYHSRSYWKYLWPSMRQRYRTMQDFIEEYTDKAMQQYQLSQAMKSIPYSASNKSSDKEKQYYDKRREISKTFNSNYNSYSNKSYDKSKKTHSFSNINQEHSDSESDSDQSTWRNANPVESNEEQVISNDEDSLSEASNEGEDTKEDEDMLDNMLAAFANHSEVKADKKDYPCLRKILSGKCEMESCPYGHRRETLLKGAQDMKAKLSAYLSAQGDPNAKGSTGPPYKVLQKEKYGKH